MNINVYTNVSIMLLKEMTELKSPKSRTKANIIADLIKSPMNKSDIISKYSKQSSKGIYKHIIDLQYDKILKEINTKGSKPVLVLNKRNFTSASKAFEYLMDVNKNLSQSFDRAFVECAISAYGDFPIINPRGNTGTGIYLVTMNALMKAERPDIDDQLMATVFHAVEKTRGN